MSGTAETARQYELDVVHYLRKTITFADDGNEVEIGWIPEGAIVIDAGAVVTTAFNDSTTDQINIGNADDPDEFATLLDVSSVGQKKADELATAGDLGPYSVATQIVAQYNGGTGDSTAGSAVVWVAFLVDNT